VGGNYIPATAINELEMWRRIPSIRNVRPGTRWAENLGMNSMRVFLPRSALAAGRRWIQNRASTNSCASRQASHQTDVRFYSILLGSIPKTGKQRAPKPGVHNSGWMQSPGADALKDPAISPPGSIRQRGGRRVCQRQTHQCLDVWNEPDNLNNSSYGKLEPSNKVDLVLALLPQVYEWARAAGAYNR